MNNDDGGVMDYEYYMRFKHELVNIFDKWGIEIEVFVLLYWYLIQLFMILVLLLFINKFCTY